MLDIKKKENERRERGDVLDLLRESGETKVSAVILVLILVSLFFSIKKIH